MKNLILLIAVLIVSACATTSTVKCVAGVYEIKVDEGRRIKGVKQREAYRMVFLENGISEWYKNSDKRAEAKWSIVNGELHIVDKYGDTAVCRINKDGNITVIARINRDGIREDGTDIIQATTFTFGETFKRIK